MNKLEHAIQEVENNGSLRACYRDDEWAQVEALLAAAKMLPEMVRALKIVQDYVPDPSIEGDKDSILIDETLAKAQELLK